MTIKLDDIDKNLLDIIQTKFPLESEPFTVLGQRLGADEDEVIRRISRFKKEGIVRLIGPVLNPKQIGYQTTLIAMRVRPELLAKAAQTIAEHPLVSHCYERNHDFNLWFTLAIPTETDMNKEVQKLGNVIKSDATLNLPAVKMFKIGAYFNTNKKTAPIPDSSSDSTVISTREIKLSPVNRYIINELQQDLPLRPMPFDVMSNNLALPIEEFLIHCRGLIQHGVIRRYSASISHTNLGFVANAMSCWQVPSNMVEMTGKKMATFPEISHCYERNPDAGWHYNMFAMIHAENKETCQALALKICSDTGLEPSSFILLFSTKEIKKTRIRYQV
jgi:DNA-binding Lrp family transcriptional regulator